MYQSISIRRTSRAVLLAPDSRMLLFEFDLPAGVLAPERRVFWGLPGGAMEEGEDPLGALRRELREETGLDGVDIGPELWFGSNEITLHGKPTRTHERFFLVRTPAHDLDFTAWTPAERRVIRQHRWWSVSELFATADNVFPPRLCYWLYRFLRHGTAGPEEIPL